MALQASGDAAAQRSWFRRHKILTAVASVTGFFFVLGVVGAIVQGPTPTTPSSNAGSDAAVKTALALAPRTSADHQPAAPPPPVAPELSPEAMTAASNSTYALDGYELGVQPIVTGNLAVCPYEVASWGKSIPAGGISVYVSARGPVALTATTTLVNRSTSARTAAIDGGHSQVVIQFPGSPYQDVSEVVLKASDGGEGVGGSCAVAAAGGTETGVQYCAKKSWPQSIPTDVVGLNWSDATDSYRELGCLNLGTSTSVVDGHDVGAETINNYHSSEVVSVSPAVGSKVVVDTRVNLTVRPTDR
jgi:hypothetical protein